MAPPLANSPYQLRVEGRDDHHCVIHLLRRYGFDWDDITVTRPYVSYAEGKDELLASLSVIVKSSYTRVGVIIDADAVIANRWAQVRDRLRDAGLMPPVEPDPGGTIIPGLLPGSRFGIWLMPDNTNSGRLEEFLATLINNDASCWRFAQEATATAVAHGCPLSDHVKSALHAWLAWQEEPGLPFGTALRARIFRDDSQEALGFVSWFRRLFV